MPPTKYNTPEERKEGHRIAALKYARKNIIAVLAKNNAHYVLNRDAINTRRREKYAARKALKAII